MGRRRNPEHPSAALRPALRRASRASPTADRAMHAIRHRATSLRVRSSHPRGRGGKRWWAAARRAGPASPCTYCRCDDRDDLSAHRSGHSRACANAGLRSLGCSGCARSIAARQSHPVACWLPTTSPGWFVFAINAPPPPPSSQVRGARLPGDRLAGGEERHHLPARRAPAATPASSTRKLAPPMPGRNVAIFPRARPPTALPCVHFHVSNCCSWRSPCGHPVQPPRCNTARRTTASSRTPAHMAAAQPGRAHRQHHRRAAHDRARSRWRRRIATADGADWRTLAHAYARRDATAIGITPDAQT